MAQVISPVLVLKAISMHLSFYEHYDLYPRTYDGLGQGNLVSQVLSKGTPEAVDIMVTSLDELRG